MHIKVQLQGGEKDGATPIIEVPIVPRPGTIIYTWATKHDQRIHEAQHRPQRYEGLVSMLSVLAYQYTGQTITREDGRPVEYLFRRHEPADKAVSDPAV
jgi:hypothetical protein